MTGLNGNRPLLRAARKKPATTFAGAGAGAGRASGVACAVLLRCVGTIKTYRRQKIRRYFGISRPPAVRPIVAKGVGVILAAGDEARCLAGGG